MMEINKPISDKLASLIKEAVESVSDFYDNWGRAVKLGKEEGLSVEELQEIARPLLRVKLSSKQVWYLFHQEEQKTRSKQQYDNAKRSQDRTNISTNDVEKDTEESDIDEQIQQDVPVTQVVDLKRSITKGEQAEDSDDDLPPEMQAIAAKQIEPTNPLDIAVVGRYGLFDTKKTAEVLQRDLAKLKSSGWKVVEITARHIS